MKEAVHALISELDQEAATTRRLLQRVPAEKFGWKPHPKSKSLGELSYHIASIPGGIASLMLQEGTDAKKTNFQTPCAESMDQLMQVLDEGVSKAKGILADLSPDRAMAPWRLTAGDQEVFSIPRIGVARTILLNHWYHHRGQLTVYLRLLDVPLPVVYGRSADENPFA